MCHVYVGHPLRRATTDRRASLLRRKMIRLAAHLIFAINHPQKPLVDYDQIRLIQYLRLMAPLSAYICVRIISPLWKVYTKLMD